METKLKQKLLTTSPFEVIEKIVGNSHKAVKKLFAEDSFIASRSNEASKVGRSNIFQHVKVNYSYSERMQPSLYGRRHRSEAS